jgi:hypothetical protein
MSSDSSGVVFPERTDSCAHGLPGALQPPKPVSIQARIEIDPMTNHGIPHMTKPGSISRRLLGSAVLAASMILLASPGQAQSGPFANLAGAWSGSGKILIKDGGSESIRCRATYTVAGAGLNQVLRCASDSYRFDLTTNVTASGNNLSGSWSETSRNVNGTLGGKISGGEIEALVEANGFAASLSMKTSGNKQTIAIRSQNTDLRGVDITLTR